MGSGAFKVAIAEETEKPVDGTDIDTPRGVSAKAEVKRLRMLVAKMKEEKVDEMVTKALLGDVPSLTTYLSRVFTISDKDGSGSLSREEFWNIFEGLQMKISPEKVDKLKEISDMDKDGLVNLEEFIKSAPGYFKILTESEEVSSSDWTQLQDETGTLYYYNMRTGESQWEMPTALEPQVEDNAASLELQEKIGALFAQADENGSDTISKEEFWVLVLGKLDLGLDAEGITSLQTKFDANADGVINWKEFMEAGPAFIEGLKGKQKSE